MGIYFNVALYLVNCSLVDTVQLCHMMYLSFSPI